MADQPRNTWTQPETIKWMLQILIIPATGWIVSQVAGHILAESQARESDRRVYADMVSRREQSESTLRKDMFQTILQPVLTQKKDEVEQNVLRLEMLAYNFHDSLDVGPLFKDIYRQLSARSDEMAERLRKRLEDSAREVIGKEIDSLREAGSVLERTVYMNKIPAEGVAVVDGEELKLRGPSAQARLFRVEVLTFNPDRKEFRVRMEVFTGNPPTPELKTKPFWVGPFDFPMIDNTRLPGGQRVAIALAMPIDGSSTEISVVYFPGSRASLKDRQYYEDMTEELLKVREEMDRKKSR